MNWWIVLVIAAPLLFVVGTVLNALKEQKRFEQGELQKILKERRKQRNGYIKKHGINPRDPYEDEDDQ